MRLLQLCVKPQSFMHRFNISSSTAVDPTLNHLTVLQENEHLVAKSEEQNADSGCFAPGQDAQLPENVDEDDEDDFRDAPNDTLAAVLLLKAQFPKLQGREVAPLVLRSQIYSIVKDRTIVDRQLDELRCAQPWHQSLNRAAAWLQPIV